MKELLKGWNTIPNWLTYLRIVLVPVFAVLFYKGYIAAALIVLAVSGLSDFFDGKIARRFNMVSDLGKLIDPVADKLTEITIAVLFFLKFREGEGLIKTFSWIFLIFIIKEFLMVAFGAFMLSIGLRPSAAEIWGKAATMVFYLVMIAIVMFGPGVGLLAKYWTIPDLPLLIMVIVSAVLTVVAFIGYIPSSAKQILDKIKSKKADNSGAKV